MSPKNESKYVSAIQEDIQDMISYRDTLILYMMLQVTQSPVCKTYEKKKKIFYNIKGQIY